ncbi:Cubilin, partial [Pseudolycoriella hygida]
MLLIKIATFSIIFASTISVKCLNLVNTQNNRDKDLVLLSNVERNERNNDQLKFIYQNYSRVYRDNGVIYGDSSSKCGGTFRSVQTTIQSPDYPNEYQPNLYCEYVFKSPFVCKNEFHIQFLFFSLETSKDCVKDHLKIGKHETLCGKAIGIMKYKAMDGVLKITFATDNNVEGLGFNLLVTRLPCSDEESSTIFPIYERETTENDEWSTNAIEFTTSSVEESTTEDINFDKKTKVEDTSKTIYYDVVRPILTLQTPIYDHFGETQNKSYQFSFLGSNGNGYLPPPSTDIHTTHTNCYPVGGGQHPIDGGQYPIGGGQYPIGGGQYPIGGGQYPIGGGQYPIGGGQYPIGGGQYPIGGGQYPIGGGQYPIGGGQYPIGGGQYPVGGGQYPNQNPWFGFPQLPVVPPINVHPNTNFPSVNNNLPPTNNFPSSNGFLPPSNGYLPPSNGYLPPPNTNHFPNNPPTHPTNSFYPSIAQPTPSLNDEPTTPTRDVVQAQVFPSAIPQCCTRQFNQQRFYVASPNFPTKNTQNVDCLHYINRNNPSVCRIRIEFKFFFMGYYNPQFGCADNFIEIDGRRICGCQSGMRYVSQWGIGSKIIRVHSRAGTAEGVRGFLLDVIQEPCPYRFSRSNKLGSNETNWDRSDAVLHRAITHRNSSSTTTYYYYSDGSDEEKPKGQLETKEDFEHRAEGPNARFFFPTTGQRNQCVFSYSHWVQLLADPLW